MDDKAERFLEIFKQCDSFFKESIDNAIKNQRAHISDEAKFYLMGVLVMGFNTDPHSDTKGLTEKYMIAQNSESYEGFRIIGDWALLISGIWWQSLLRKSIDVDYYIDIGRQAYQQASASAPRNLSQLLEELADNFVVAVDILIEVTECINKAKVSNTDILRMYEVWQRTHSVFIEQKLRSLGINVVPGTTKIQ